jgi:hypothetical protein
LFIVQLDNTIFKINNFRKKKDLFIYLKKTPMSNTSKNNALYALIGLSALALAIDTLLSRQSVKESFGGLPSFRVKAMQVAGGSGPQKGDFYEVPGNYQSMLSPRFSNADYGAYIRYQTPQADHMAVNMNNPLTYANMIQQKGYPRQQQARQQAMQQASQQQCQQIASSQTKESYGCREKYGEPIMGSQSYARQQGQLQYNQVTDMLPVQNMGQGQMVNALGEQVAQPIIYDRYIYANQRSRLTRDNDLIRGSLPIVPVKSDWFRPSVHPQIDLSSGALAVIGGLDNDTSKELMALQNASAGGALDVGSGINYSVQKNLYGGAAGGDIQVTSFP